MDKLVLPYINPVTRTSAPIPVTVEDGRLHVNPLLKMLKLAKTTLAKYDTGSMPACPTLSMVDLEAWLRTLPNTSLARHLQGHLLPFIRLHSISLKVVEEQHAMALQAESEAVIMVNRPLDALDRFRADASVGGLKMAPEQINLTVRAGVLDLFFKEQDVFGDGGSIVRHLEVPITKNTYRKQLLHDLRRGRPEVMNGPQFQSKYPNHPLLARRTLPPLPVVKVDNGQTRVELLPERLAPHRWERYLEK